MTTTKNIITHAWPYFRMAVTGEETKIMVLLSQSYLSFTGVELYDGNQRRICCIFLQICEHMVWYGMVMYGLLIVINNFS